MVDYEKETCFYVKDVCNKFDYEISFDAIYLAWSRYSDSMCAGWLSHSGIKDSGIMHVIKKHRIDWSR